MRVHRKLISFVFFAFVIFSLLVGVGGVSAYADTFKGYTDVLEDLQKDETFKAEDYPAKENDYSLQVIQIAESTGGELFVYVYQPCANTFKLTATEIRISQSIGENIAPKDFNLTLLNRNGVFAKYGVNDFFVKSDIVRYYDIIQLSRKWEESIDKDTHEPNDINTVAYAVAKRFTACTLNGAVSYTCIDNEVIEIKPESKHVGYFEFFEGLGFCSFSEADCWYVGFDTNKPIDNLYEAEISFKTRTVERHYGFGIQTSERFGDWQYINNLKIDHEDKGSAGNGFLAHKYEWQRIVSIEEFTTNPDYKLSDSEKENMRGCKWVLRFYETERKMTGDYKVNQKLSSEVANVTILRLKFETDGITYNLGVVDNEQSPKPDQLPGNVSNKNGGCSCESPFPWWVWLIIIICLPLIVYLILKFGLNAVWTVIKTILYAVWWVISAPFRGIAWLIRKITGGEK